jgi:hypothetical protein
MNYYYNIENNNYKKWYDLYYDHNKILFNKLIQLTKKYGLKTVINTDKYFENFCEFIYYNSSKRIDSYI